MALGYPFSVNALIHYVHQVSIKMKKDFPKDPYQIYKCFMQNITIAQIVTNIKKIPSCWKQGNF